MPRITQLRRQVYVAWTRKDLFIIGAAASVVLVAVVVTLLWLARALDSSEYLSAVDAALTVQRLDAAWNSELTRVRNDPEANFDALSEFVRRLVEQTEAVVAAVSRVAAPAARLDDDVRALVHALNEKKKHTDRFKSQYAVLRTTMSNLPRVTSTLAEDSNIDHEFLRSILSVHAALDHLVANPASGTAEDVEAAVRDLKNHSAAALPEQTADDIAWFTANVAALAERLASVHQEFVQATSSQAGELAGVLAQALQNSAANREHRAESYLNASIGIGAVLLCLWSGLALWKLGRANTQPANHGATEPVEEDRQSSDTGGQPFIERLVLHKILAEVVSMKLTETAQAIADCVDVLTEVRNYARSEASRKAKALADIRVHARDVRTRAERLDELAADSDDTVSTGTRFDLAECIERAVHATGVEFVALVTVKRSGPRHVVAPPAVIYVALEGVLVNAVRAMDGADEKREITIFTHCTEDHLAVEVVASGLGEIPADIDGADHLVHPMNSERTGLGLAAIRYLLSKYDGSLSVESSPETGSVVRIALPTATPDWQGKRADSSARAGHAEEEQPRSRSHMD